MHLSSGFPELSPKPLLPLFGDPGALSTSAGAWTNPYFRAAEISTSLPGGKTLSNPLSPASRTKESRSLLLARRSEQVEK